MAQLLWGKVYYQNQFAGLLREEPGDTFNFTYDASYLQNNNPAIAHTLPLQAQPHLSYNGLHPFFDNLVAEGWLEHAQMRLLEKRTISRIELLLAFGLDCAGAVSVVDPEPARLSNQMLDVDDTKEMALLTSRASLSGIQPKLAIIQRDGKFYPTRMGEISTYIAKFPSSHHADLVHNEYCCTLAMKALLPQDNVVEAFLGNVEGQSEPALLIKRFDRADHERIHFEEFNALLGKSSSQKYDGQYTDMADFIRTTPHCLPAENHRLYARILAGILIGNTDMHLKNFAMLHTPAGLRLTPAYDAVAAALYQYKTMALGMAGVNNLRISDIKPRQLIMLGESFGLSMDMIATLIDTLSRQKDNAMNAVAQASGVDDALKDHIVNMMEKRWNGTFALIGQALSKKP